VLDWKYKGIICIIILHKKYSNFINVWFEKVSLKVYFNKNGVVSIVKNKIRLSYNKKPWNKSTTCNELCAINFDINIL